MGAVVNITAQSFIFVRREVLSVDAKVFHVKAHFDDSFEIT